MTDEMAIVLCQEGDRDAFRYLVERYKDVLYGTACLMTGSRAHAGWRPAIADIAADAQCARPPLPAAAD